MHQVPRQPRPERDFVGSDDGVTHSSSSTPTRDVEGAVPPFSPTPSSLRIPTQYRHQGTKRSMARTMKSGVSNVNESVWSHDRETVFPVQDPSTKDMWGSGDPHSLPVSCCGLLPRLLHFFQGQVLEIFFFIGVIAVATVLFFDNSTPGSVLLSKILFLIAFAQVFTKVSIFSLRFAVKWLSSTIDPLQKSAFAIVVNTTDPALWHCLFSCTLLLVWDLWMLPLVQSSRAFGFFSDVREDQIGTTYEYVQARLGYVRKLLIVLLLYAIKGLLIDAAFVYFSVAAFRARAGVLQSILLRFDCFSLLDARDYSTHTALTGKTLSKGGRTRRARVLPILRALRIPLGTGQGSRGNDQSVDALERALARSAAARKECKGVPAGGMRLLLRNRTVAMHLEGTGVPPPKESSKSTKGPPSSQNQTKRSSIMGHMKTRETSLFVRRVSVPTSPPSPSPSPGNLEAATRSTSHAPEAISNRKRDIDGLDLSPGPRHALTLPTPTVTNLGGTPIRPPSHLPPDDDEGSLNSQQTQSSLSTPAPPVDLRANPVPMTWWQLYRALQILWHSRLVIVLSGEPISIVSEKAARRAAKALFNELADREEDEAAEEAQQLTERTTTRRQSPESGGGADPEVEEELSNLDAKVPSPGVLRTTVTMACDKHAVNRRRGQPGAGVWTDEEDEGQEEERRKGQEGGPMKTQRRTRAPSCNCNERGPGLGERKADVTFLDSRVFRRYMPREAADLFAGFLDPSRDGRVAPRAFADCLCDTFKDREGMREALQSKEGIGEVVTTLLNGFLWFVLFIAIALVFEVRVFQVVTAFVGTAGVMAAVGLFLSGTLSDLIDSLVFVFFQHPYEINDIVKLPLIVESAGFGSTYNVNCTVKGISMMTTTFETLTNEIHIVPNYVLAKQPILNRSRCGTCKQDLFFRFLPTTSEATLDELRASIVAYLAERPTEWNDKDFFTFIQDLRGGAYLEWKVALTSKLTYGSIGNVLTCRDRVFFFIQREAERLGIVFKQPVQPVEVSGLPDALAVSPLTSKMKKEGEDGEGKKEMDREGGHLSVPEEYRRF
uniref:Mechanosensitive ion channel MscS domain-containing protein n=1 Tax=Chromera velia CCMP2878 TaxID=1169474 RepID=A0A0G4G296_9ALVE|eukprot:Cvel_19873.t1-p1 / transcript=Cvel_19873.t1 / gene=Cvel_19873 / organism=Chromera_velia_CCMP2878 / gene_product=Mechanosensitive ion channel protein 10, putative / transcript_product=Mechanosensitive ion channel protein 10, putative / location=Cvel_scaffold1743:17658-22073(-) / protein_length=1058 / sequence_SO=supercontig / SO=protein_coding / is_pseudo=false